MSTADTATDRSTEPHYLDNDERRVWVIPTAEAVAAFPEADNGTGNRVITLLGPPLDARTDIICTEDGSVWRLYKAPCGLGCYCGARAVRIA